MDNRDRFVLGTCMLVTFVTGSIHAFSVLLVPLEDLLHLSRAKTSLFYSVALVFLTGSVLFGHLVYGRFRPAALVAISCLVAGTGLLVCSIADTFSAFLLGYSVLFGLANGLAYGYVLQLAGQSLSNRRGFAMAAVTAAYATGSVVFSFVLSRLVSEYSVTIALAFMGIVIIGSGLLGAFAIGRTGVAWEFTRTAPGAGYDRRRVVTIWAAYGGAVLAGLMAIGHAAGMIQALGGEYRMATFGAVFTGIGSALGGFMVGAILDRCDTKKLLIILPLLSAVSLIALAFATSLIAAIALLAMAGFCYGAVIAVYPFAIAKMFGNQGPRIYGLVFTAWGAAGLVGPWVAGRLYDSTFSYTPALLVAAGIALVSVTVVSLAPRSFRMN